MNRWIVGSRSCWMHNASLQWHTHQSSSSIKPFSTLRPRFSHSLSPFHDGGCSSRRIQHTTCYINGSNRRGIPVQQISLFYRSLSSITDAKKQSIRLSRGTNTSNKWDTVDDKNILKTNSDHESFDKQDEDEIPQGQMKPSARRRFQEIPVYPFILERIIELGVGMKPRKLDIMKRSRKGRTSSSTLKGKQQGDSVLLSEKEESAYFAKHTNQQRIKPVVEQRKDGSTTSKSSKPSTSQQHEQLVSTCVPPPPFAPSSSAVTTRYFKTKNSNQQGKNKSQTNKVLTRTTIIRRPVAVLKSVASLQDEFPKSTRNLPEIALAGRLVFCDVTIQFQPGIWLRPGPITLLPTKES